MHLSKDAKTPEENISMWKRQKLSPEEWVQRAKYFAKVCLEKARSKLGKNHFNLIMSFWGISYPFCEIGYERLAEFYAYKKTNSRTHQNCLVRCFKEMGYRFHQKWFCVGYNNIWFFNHSTDETHKIRDSVAIDQFTTIEIRRVHYEALELVINTPRRYLLLKFLDIDQGLYALHMLLQSFTLSHYTQPHRFGSFAPIRPFNKCEFKQQGEEYFTEVYELFNKAAFEIMITGWYISPEFPLIRPVVGKLKDFPGTLENVLKRVADRGVKVYILVYNESKNPMYNDSEYVKKTLERLNKANIKVIRHPKFLLPYWSHHEKMVLVDRKYALIGGLDIAWGRWDTSVHRLFDQVTERKSFETFPGLDFYNPYIKDIVNSRNFDKPLINDLQQPSTFHPRMPWNDYAVKLEGPIVRDFLTHFVTYWNNAREDYKEHNPLVTQFIIPDKDDDISKHRMLKDTIVSESHGILAGLFRIDPEIEQAQSPTVAPDQMQHNASNLPQLIKKADSMIIESRGNGLFVRQRSLNHVVRDPIELDTIVQGIKHIIEQKFIPMNNGYLLSWMQVVPSCFHLDYFSCRYSDSRLIFISGYMGYTRRDELEADLVKDEKYSIIDSMAHRGKEEPSGSKVHLI